MEYFKARPDYPPGLLGNVPHTHRPIDDARGDAFQRPSARPLRGGFTRLRVQVPTRAAEGSGGRGGPLRTVRGRLRPRSAPLHPGLC